MSLTGDFEWSFGNGAGEVVYKNAAYVTISTEMYADYFAPWLRPDRNPMPRFVLFPRLARIRNRWLFAKQRWAEIVDVARNGMPEPAEEDDLW